MEVGCNGKRTAWKQKGYEVTRGHFQDVTTNSQESATIAEHHDS